MFPPHACECMRLLGAFFPVGATHGSMEGETVCLLGSIGEVETFERYFQSDRID